MCGESIPAIAGRSTTAVVPRCWMCTRVKMPFSKAEAFGAYDGALRGLVHLLKYERVTPAAERLGELLASVFAGLMADKLSTDKLIPDPPGDFLVIPVPLHRTRRRARGFNQSERIARIALRGLKNSRLLLTPELLVRVRETVTQTGLTRHQRRANLHGAFQVRQPERLQGRSVILVDDVLTTGTTAYECSRVLLRAGAEKVLVATVARVYRDQQVRVHAVAGTARTAVVSFQES